MRDQMMCCLNNKFLQGFLTNSTLLIQVNEGITEGINLAINFVQLIDIDYHKDSWLRFRKAWSDVVVFVTGLVIYLVLVFLLLLSGDVEVNPGPGKIQLTKLTIYNYDIGDSKELLRSCSDKLIDAFENRVMKITNVLYAKGLIPKETRNEIRTTVGISNYDKASKLMAVIEGQLESLEDPDYYLIKFCQALTEGHKDDLLLMNILTAIQRQLGK